MRPDKLKERKRLKALEIVASLGIDTSTYVFTPAKDLDEHPENLARQGEAALAFLAKPSGFTTKECLYCKEYFGTDYNSVGYCSNNCRDKDFFNQTGYKVNWASKSDVARWNGEPPLVIDPETLKHLAQWYHQLKSQIESQTPVQTVPEPQSTELLNVVQTIQHLSPVESSTPELEDIEFLFVVE